MVHHYIVCCDLSGLKGKSQSITNVTLNKKVLALYPWTLLYISISGFTFLSLLHEVYNLCVEHFTAHVYVFVHNSGGQLALKITI